MPEFLDPLWQTVLHAPNVAFDPVRDALREGIPAPRARLSAVLAWLGHADGDCPVCWMFTGKLVYTFEEPVRLLAEVLSAAPGARVRAGASLFVRTQLSPRHALGAGLSRERLEALRAEVRALPAALRTELGLR